MDQFLSGSILIAVALSAQPLPPSSMRTKVVQAPPIQAYQPKATAIARKEQILDQQQKSAPSRFDLQKYPLADRHLQHWQESLWAIGVLAPEKEYALQALENVLQLTTAANLTDPQKAIIDTAMQVSHQLYTLKPAVYGKLRQHFIRTIDRSTDPQWVAISLSALAKSPVYPQTAQTSQVPAIAKLIKKVQTRFPRWSEDLHLRTTLANIQSSSPNSQNTQPSAASRLPDLGELLRWQIAPQQSQMYVLCRPDRDVLCVTLLKDGNGKFVRQNSRKSGQIWSVPLLLQSIHNLDWNFTNGRTPQGVYRMEGISRQPDDEYFHAYGQFSLVNLFVPFESGANKFLPNHSPNQKSKFTGNLTSDLKAYQTLLPPAWRNFAPMQETFWAGKMGRSLFRIHGSGAAIDFFQNKAAVVNAGNFDWNPTLGCLSAIELYDDRGSLVKTDMTKILNALNTVGKGKIEGYLIVVDVPSDSGDPNAPIAIAEIEKLIDNAKKN